MTNTTAPTIDSYTVSELNNLTRDILENTFKLVWIEGEISNFSQPRSGHCYFTLKDDDAQVRAALFRQYRRNIDCTLEDGMHVQVRAKVSLYAPRGDYQLIAYDVIDAGAGKLQRAFDTLKKKLQTEGLFDDEHKKPLPRLPKQIGIITSPTGAALRDMLHVLKRRFPAIPVMIYPSMVQGDAAAGQLVRAIETANAHNNCDVLIVSRGGGSLEDLWPFNEESVARAIFASTLPIISGVGHEVDFTIADFVSDFRAPTPSAAAECATPDKSELIATVNNQQHLMTRHIQQHLAQARDKINMLTKRLRHPKAQIEQTLLRLDHLSNQLHRAIKQQVGNKQQQLRYLAGRLDTLSPLKTLERGYTIIRDKQDNVIASTADCPAGTDIVITLRDGQREASITD